MLQQYLAASGSRPHQWLHQPTSGYLLDCWSTAASVAFWLTTLPSLKTFAAFNLVLPSLNSISPIWTFWATLLSSMSSFARRFLRICCTWVVQTLHILLPCHLLRFFVKDQCFRIKLRLTKLSGSPMTCSLNWSTESSRRSRLSFWTSKATLFLRLSLLRSNGMPEWRGARPIHARRDLSSVSIISLKNWIMFGGPFAVEAHVFNTFLHLPSTNFGNTWRFLVCFWRCYQ